jgi:hypothetical protein
VTVRRAALAALPLLLAVQPAHAAGPAKENSCAPHFPTLKWWDGVWGGEGLDGDIAGSVRNQSKFTGADAPWNAEGWKRMRQLAAFNRAHSLRIAAAWGFPMMMNSYSEVKFVVAPGETVMTSQYRDIRYIYTDGRKHPSQDELWVNNWGDSIGCWKGDTLVVDTIGAKFDPVFNYFAAPLSDQAHFTERLRAVAKDRIEGEVTITDPATLSGPWTVKFAFVPAGIDRMVHEGDTLIDREKPEGNAATIEPPDVDPLSKISIPPEVALSAAQLDGIAGKYGTEGQPPTFAFERRGERLFYRIEPGAPGARPLFADGALSFSGLNGEAIRFETDASGKVVGVAGSGPFGMVVKGKRLGS